MRWLWIKLQKWCGFSAAVVNDILSIVALVAYFSALHSRCQAATDPQHLTDMLRIKFPHHMSISTLILLLQIISAACEREFLFLHLVATVFSVEFPCGKYVKNPPSMNVADAFTR